MVDWVSGMADASVSERNSGSVLVRVPGSPDVLKEAAISGFVTKDASGSVGIGTDSPAEKLTVAGNLRVGIATEPNAYNFNIVARSPASGTIDWDFKTSDATYGAKTLVIMSSAGAVLAGADNVFAFGGASNRWAVIYSSTGTINTSDERAKTGIGEIPDAWLDAWAGVEWRRFKMVDGKRWHVGLVAQQVHAAFAARDLDAFEIGLCCFDAWEEQREPIYETVTKTRKATRTEQIPAGELETGEPLFKLVEVAFDEEYEESIDTGKTRVTLEAGDRWGLRYDECQAIEAAYQRRELARIEARLAALENGGQEAGA